MNNDEKEDDLPIINKNIFKINNNFNLTLAIQ